jgi:hypothetical protein
MLRMEKLCAVIGFTKDMIDCLLTRKEAIQCNGKIYSEEHRRKFEIKILVSAKIFSLYKK